MYEKMNQTQKPLKNDLIVNNPKTPKQARFNSNIPKRGRSVLAFFLVKKMVQNHMEAGYKRK